MIIPFTFLTLLLLSVQTVYAGEMKEFRYRDGSLRMRLRYENGLMQGIQEEFFHGGLIRRKKHYEGGIPHGKDQFYFSNGKLQMERSFVKGKLHGKSKEWDESGKKMAEHQFSEGDNVGESVFYGDDAATHITTTPPTDGTHQVFYENGKLKTEMTYKDGKLEGISRDYTQDGWVWSEVEYHDGLLHGYARSYDRLGRKVEERFYREDDWRWTKSYDKQGNLRNTETANKNQ